MLHRTPSNPTKGRFFLRRWEPRLASTTRASQDNCADGLYLTAFSSQRRFQSFRRTFQLSIGLEKINRLAEPVPTDFICWSHKGHHLELTNDLELYVPQRSINSPTIQVVESLTNNIEGVLGEFVRAGR